MLLCSGSGKSGRLLRRLCLAGWRFKLMDPGVPSGAYLLVFLIRYIAVNTMSVSAQPTIKKMLTAMRLNPEGSLP